MLFQERDMQPDTVSTIHNTVVVFNLIVDQCSYLSV